MRLTREFFKLLKRRAGWTRVRIGWRLEAGFIAVLVSTSSADLNRDKWLDSRSLDRRLCVCWHNWHRAMQAGHLFAFRRMRYYAASELWTPKSSLLFEQTNAHFPVWRIFSKREESQIAFTNPLGLWKRQDCLLYAWRQPFSSNQFGLIPVVLWTIFQIDPFGISNIHCK